MFFASCYDLILNGCEKMNVNEINAGVLAYVGDAVYEVFIREYLIKKIPNNVNELQREAINFVSAKSQAEILERLIAKNILTEEELLVVHRARNHKPNSKPKHTDIKTYKKATALEALFGTLYIKEQNERIEKIMKEILG